MLLKGCRNHDRALYITGHKSPANRARELFTHSKDAESLVVSVIKILGSYGVGFFVSDVIIEVGLCFWMTSSGVRAKFKRQFFVSFLEKTRPKSASLEPLTAF